MRQRFGLEVAAIALVLSACTVGPSEIPSPPATGASSPSLGPTVAVSSTPVPTASASAAAEPLPNVRTTPLGRVAGNWLFYGVQVPRPERNRTEIQIVAVPVGGGAAKIVVAFDAAIPTPHPNDGPPERIFDNTPYLRRQFSPDGTRMVFSIDGQLVVIELVTGQAKALGVRGFYPSWSRDGSQIAFVFGAPVTPATIMTAIGVVPAAGGSPRKLALTNSMVFVIGNGGAMQISPHGSVEWSPDGSRIFFNPLPPGCVDVCGVEHVTMEVASGRIGPTQIAWVAGAHWRVGSPELAVVTQICARSDLVSGAEARIVGVDAGTGSVRTLVDVAEPCVEVQEPGGYTGVRERVQLRDPRWNPAVADELLYVAERGTAGADANDFETHVVNIATGRDTRLPISAYEATWTWDGSAVAYLVKTPGSSLGSAVRVWKRDGGGETELRRATGGEAFFSIASVSY